MPNRLVYPLGNTASLTLAADLLPEEDIPVIDHPAPEVTHLLLDIPSFASEGMLRCGKAIEDVLAMLPDTVTVIGGNLNHPALAGYKCVDLLQDEDFAAKNAVITAYCAVKIGMEQTDRMIQNIPVLIIGWGRIGKCLVRLLKNMDADVTVCCRKSADRGILRALGINAAAPDELPDLLPQFALIYNTAPAAVISESLSAKCAGIKIDLASKPGILGKDVIVARGLPGRMAPGNTAELIAASVVKYISGRDKI